MLKLVIFDLDGVLVDACEWHRLALNQALKEISGYEIELKDHIEKYNGLPSTVKLSMLNEAGLVQKEDNASIHALKQKKTIELIETQLTIDYTKIELMEWLSAYPLKIACYTNCISKTANLMLSRVGVEQYLNIVITNEDVAAPKPDPEGYLEIMKHLYCTPEECMVIEDSPKGLAAAHATGAKVMQVSNAKGVTKIAVERFINENFGTDGRRRQQIC